MKLSDLIKELNTIKRQHGDMDVIIYRRGEQVVPSPSLWVRHDKNDKVVEKIIDLMPHEEP